MKSLSNFGCHFSSVSTLLWYLLILIFLDKNDKDNLYWKYSCTERVGPHTEIDTLLGVFCRYTNLQFVMIPKDASIFVYWYQSSLSIHFVGYNIINSYGASVSLEMRLKERLSREALTCVLKEGKCCNCSKIIY